MNNMNNKEYYEDEVNLRDYVEVILKYKWLIIGIFVMALVIAGIATFMMPKTYKSEATIEIAQVNEPIYTLPEVEHLILSDKVLKPVIEKFSSDFKDSITLKSFREILKVNSIKDTDFVKISIECKDAEISKKVLGSIIENFFAFGESQYNKKLSLLKEDLQIINQQMENIKIDLEAIKQRSSLTESQKQVPLDEMSKILLSQQLISDLKEDYSTYLFRSMSLKNKINIAENFQVISSPEIPAKAISPKKTQIISITGIISLMLAVFLAFFIEFLHTSEPSEKVKKSRKTKNSKQ